MGKLDPKKVVFSRQLSLTEAVQAYSILMESLRYDDTNQMYYYVIVEEDFNLFIEAVDSKEVHWLANKLSVEDRQALVCLIEYPAFWEDLKDILYMCGINDYKKFSVFTKNDLIGEGNRVWEEYLGDDESDAYHFYSEILLVEDIVSIIEMNDEI